MCQHWNEQPYLAIDIYTCKCACVHILAHAHSLLTCAQRTQGADLKLKCITDFKYSISCYHFLLFSPHISLKGHVSFYLSLSVCLFLITCKEAEKPWTHLSHSHDVNDTYTVSQIWKTKDWQSWYITYGSSHVRCTISNKLEISCNLHHKLFGYVQWFGRVSICRRGSEELLLRVLIKRKTWIERAWHRRKLSQWRILSMRDPVLVSFPLL